MRSGYSFARSAATWIARHAGAVLLPHRPDWAKAMASEVDHLSSDSAAFHWAIGCLIASYRERIKITLTRNLYVSRWLMSLEMLVCFVPLTWLGTTVLYVYATGNLPTQEAFLNLSAAAIGPIGLAAALWAIVFKRSAFGNGVILTLCILAGWTVLSFSALALGGMGTISNWREFFLIVLLPSIGTAHLIYVGHRAA